MISLAKTKKKTLRYKLDCVILDEEAIHLAWLGVPALSPRLDTLELSLRQFGDPDSWYSAWYEGDGHGCRLMKSLYSLLRQFLECGPYFGTPLALGIEVGTLVLNVISPSSLHLGSPVPGEEFLRTGGQTDPDVQWQKEVSITSEEVVNIMERDIGGYLQLSHSFVSLLYTKIGVISIRHNGKERKVFDLGLWQLDFAENLSHIPPSRPISTVRHLEILGHTPIEET